MRRWPCPRCEVAAARRVARAGARRVEAAHRSPATAARVGPAAEAGPGWVGNRTAAQAGQAAEAERVVKPVATVVPPEVGQVAEVE